jgi:23S rRNA-/tRNA-specific pseudouridylate synthase
MYLARALGKPVYPLHRLDRETSGVILFSKRAADTAALAATMTGKQYLAIVRGQPPAEFACDLPLGPAWVEDGRGHWRDMQGNPAPEWAGRKKRAAYAGAEEPACTSFACLAAGAQFALVEARPHTGRLHQIRAHLEACGYPVVGDKLYGGNQRLFVQFIEEGLTDALRLELGMARCALHARAIRVGAAAGVRTISAALPDDMREVLRADGMEFRHVCRDE